MQLSIIIPVYNAENYLCRCFSSIYKQPVPHDCFEVIAVNDSSKDNSLKILYELQKQYGNVSVIKQENLGVSAARNRGIEESKGKYVLFLDADDELTEGSLCNICDYLGERNIDMLMTRQLIKENGVIKYDNTPPLEENRSYSGVEAYKCGFVRTNAGGGICRAEFLRKNNILFPVGVTNGEDSIFFALVQVYAQSLVFYNLPVYLINVISDSATRNNDSSKGKKLINSIKTARYIKDTIEAKDEQKGVFEYALYQLISNTIAFYSQSRGLSYRSFIKSIDMSKVLPLDVSHMYMMRRKAQILNFSFPLFYFLSWIKNYKRVV